MERANRAALAMLSSHPALTGCAQSKATLHVAGKFAPAPYMYVDAPS